MENIGKLVKLCIRDNKEKKDWMERTGKVLKEEGIKKGNGSKNLIGSGAIESAHRNVLHKRLKQPGQRWSKKGLQNMINLRVLNKSGHWNMVGEYLGKIAA